MPSLMDRRAAACKGESRRTGARRGRSMEKSMNASPPEKFEKTAVPAGKNRAQGHEAEIAAARGSRRADLSRHWKTRGMRALITGADRASGGPSRWRSLVKARMSRFPISTRMTTPRRRIASCARYRVGARCFCPATSGLSACARKSAAARSRNLAAWTFSCEQRAAFQRTYANFEDITDAEFEETFRVNVFAMFRLCRLLLPQIPAEGSILNTASIQSFVPARLSFAYAATKGRHRELHALARRARDQARCCV